MQCYNKIKDKERGNKKMEKLLPFHLAETNEWEECLEGAIQALLQGYWTALIKYGKEEEKVLQTAEDLLEELKKHQIKTTFVVWDDFDKNIHCALFDSYSDFQEWSQADYIFRILDVR